MKNYLDVRYEKVKEKVKLLEEFYLTYGREPKTREEFKGEKIGSFLNNIRKGNTNLRKEEFLQLENMGFRLHAKDVRKEVRKKVELLKEFYLKFEREPSINEVYEGKKIGIFLQNVYNNGVKLTTEEYNDLIKVGYSFKRKIEISKERKIKAILEFYKKYRRLPKQSETYKGEKIGLFIMNIRSGKTSVPKEYVKEFKKIGVI